jgi:hypothetical protein
MRLVILMLVACSGTPKEPTLTPKQQGDLCRPSIDHLVEIMTSGDTGNVPMAARIRTSLLERCTADKWGADAVNCFRQLQTIDKADGCAKYLTVPQRDGFQQAIEGAAR